MGELIAFDPVDDPFKPCLARLDGPFLAIHSDSPIRLSCAGSEGHEGSHWIKVEWTDPDQDLRAATRRRDRADSDLEGGED